MAKLSKVQQNVEYIKGMHDKGIETITRGELPHPQNIRGIKNKAPILAIDGNRIYLNSKEDF